MEAVKVSKSLGGEEKRKRGWRGQELGIDEVTGARAKLEVHQGA